MADIGIIKFQIAGIHFGMFADRILEIVRLDDFRPIPRPLPYVVGLTELRNYIVTIVDFRKRLGRSPIARNQGTTMITLKLASGVIGLLVETISNFKRVPEAEILSPFSIAGLPAQLLQGVLATDEDIVIIPDLDKIFSSYIPIQLSSISSSEKIAFQYRSTPGAISKTLENTLISQGYLDDDIILKLPRSMSLPSVQVHKFISYYPDFQPQKSADAQDETSVGTHQQAKAGDETYFSLSKRLESQQQNSYARSAQPSGDRVQTLPFTPQKGVVHALEEILLDNSEQAPGRRILSDREQGRSVAKTLRVPSVRLTKYLSYYPHASALSSYPSSPRVLTHLLYERRKTNQTLSLDERLNGLLRHSRDNIEFLLQTLEKEGYPLNSKALRRICEHYQVSPIRIARAAHNFPKLQLDFVIKTGETQLTDDEDTPHVHRHTHGDEHEQTRDADAYRPLPPSVCRPTNLNIRLQDLADREYLKDDRAIRYAAAQLRIATCRLSKLRSYYQFRGQSLLSSERRSKPLAASQSSSRFA